MKRMLTHVGAIALVLGTGTPYVSATTNSSAPAATTWTVKSGDTLGKISRNSGVPITIIEKYNSITNPSLLKIGQVIKIPRVWVVKSGESLWSIAAVTGVSVQRIAKANGITNTAAINVGMVLIIPVAAPSASAKPTTGGNTSAANSTPSNTATNDTATQWIVKPGDTLWRISRASGVSEQALIQANKLSHPNSLTVGQVLRIPTVSKRTTATATAASRSTQWVVKSGDTLWKISQATGVSTQVIQQTNNLTKPSMLYVGQVLTIPTVATHTTSTVEPSHIYAWANNTASIKDAMSHETVDGIGNVNFVFNSSGGVVDSTPGSNESTLTKYGQSNNVNVYATVSNWNSQVGNFDRSLANRVLKSSRLKAKLEQNLVNIATRGHYAGIDIDIEQVQQSDQSAFTAFVDELSTKLHEANKKLAVTVPGDTGQPYYSGYNLGAIGRASDIVPVMTYDYHWAGGSSGPIAPLQWDNRVVQYMTSQIPANKVLLGIGAYGYDWYTGNNNMAKTLSLTQIDNLIQADHLTPHWDKTDSVPYLQYTDANGVSHTIYYENQTSLQNKMALVKHYKLGGIAFWKAGNEDTAFWNAVNGAKSTGN